MVRNVIGTLFVMKFAGFCEFCLKANFVLKPTLSTSVEAKYLPSVVTTEHLTLKID